MTTSAPDGAASAGTPAWQAMAGDLPSAPADDSDLVWQELRARFRWYDKKATNMRLAYQLLKIVSLVVAAAVPVVAAASAPPALTASLAAVVVVLEGVQQLFQLQANWIRYRGTAEAMRQHAFQYASGVGPYADANTRHGLLAEFVSSAVADEGTRWSTAMRQPSPQGETT